MYMKDELAVVDKSKSRTERRDQVVSEKEHKAREEKEGFEFVCDRGNAQKILSKGDIFNIKESEQI